MVLVQVKKAKNQKKNQKSKEKEKSKIKKEKIKKLNQPLSLLKNFLSRHSNTPGHDQG